MKRSMKIVSMSIMLAILFYLSGCCNNPPEQEDWHEKRIYAYSVVEELSDKEKQFLPKERLIALIGEPDFKMTPVELEKLLIEDFSYRKRVMSELCTEYCRVEKKLPLFDCRFQCGNGKWQENEKFKHCMLWLYDESKHFSHPLDYGCPWCAHVGFKCHVFFIQDPNVIGSTPIAFWEPLTFQRAVNQRSK